jgi:hypothetical protein
MRASKNSPQYLATRKMAVLIIAGVSWFSQLEGWRKGPLLSASIVI